MLTCEYLLDKELCTSMKDFSFQTFAFIGREEGAKMPGEDQRKKDGELRRRRRAGAHQGMHRKYFYQGI